MKEFLEFSSALFVNLVTTSDIIILFWALVTAIECIRANNSFKDVEEILKTTTRNANPEKKEVPTWKELERESQPKIVKLNKRYTLLSNLIATFPLLGMLGTVKSLIGLASGMSDTSNALEMSMFFSALTSTAWGIIFAIGFKVGTSGLASKVESCNKDYEIIKTKATGHSGE